MMLGVEKERERGRVLLSPGLSDVYSLSLRASMSP